MSTPPNPTITAPPPPPSMAQPTRGERALGAIGGALAGGAGLDFSQTALGKHIAQNQAARLDEAKFHYQNIQKVASVLGTGVDPNTGQSLTPQQEQQYNNWYNMEWQAFEKSAGASKEAKQHLGVARKMVDMVIQHGRQQAQQQKPQTATPPPPGMMAQPPAAGSPTANAQIEAARIQEQNIAAQNRIKEIQAEGAAKLAEEQGKPTAPPKPPTPPRVTSHFINDQGNYVSVFSDGTTKIEDKAQPKPTKPSPPPKLPPSPKADPVVRKAFQDYNSAQSQLDTMQKSLPAALKGDQQAMLNILANHMGMTTSQIKGIRGGQALITEAERSAPFLGRIQARFDNNGYLSGVVLTPEQMQSMVNLAKQKVDTMGGAYTRAQQAAKNGFSGPPPSMSDPGQDSLVQGLMKDYASPKSTR